MYGTHAPVCATTERGWMLTHLVRDTDDGFGALLAFDGLLTITIVFGCRHTLLVCLHRVSSPFRFLFFFFFFRCAFFPFGYVSFSFSLFLFLLVFSPPLFIFYSHIITSKMLHVTCMCAFVAFEGARRSTSIGGRGERESPFTLTPTQLLGVTIRDVATLTAVCANPPSSTVPRYSRCFLEIY